MATERRPATTARVMGQYYRDLIAEGVPDGVAGDLLRRAADEEHEINGIVLLRGPDDPPESVGPFSARGCCHQGV